MIAMIVTRLATLLVLVAAAGGCATAMRGTTQLVSVASTPSGARCTLMRDGIEAGIVAATPGQVTLARASDVLVICRKDGHYLGRTLLIAGARESLIREAMMRNQDAASGPRTSTDPKEAAAAVAGGAATAGAAIGTQALIGAGVAGSAAAAAALIPLVVVAPVSMIVDTASGTYLAYPNSISVTLVPSEFADAHSRDAAFARALTALDGDDDRLRKRFDETCGLTCKRTKPAFEAFLAERRAELARQRDTATIRPQ